MELIGQFSVRRALALLTLTGFMATALALGGAQTALADTISLGNVNTGKVTMKVGQSYGMGAVFEKASKKSFKSSNTSVVTVSSSGKLKAKKTGSATVTASCTSAGSKYSKQVKVKVVTASAYKSVKSVKLKLSQSSACVGATIATNVTFSPTGASNKNVKYTSSKPSVASIDASGTIKCLAAGTSTITVKSINGSKKSTAKLTVTELKANPASDFTYETGTYILDDTVKTGTFPGIGTWVDGDTKYSATARYGSVLKGDSEGYYGSGPFTAVDCGEGIYITAVKSSASGYVVVPDTIDGKPVVCVALSKVRNATGFNFSLCTQLKAVSFCDLDSSKCLNSIDFGSGNATVQSFELAYNGVDQLLDLTALTDLHALIFNRANGIHNGWTGVGGSLEYYYEEFVGFSHLTLSNKPSLKEFVAYGCGYNSDNLTLKNLPNLEILDISCNLYTSFDTSQFPRLRRLSCGANENLAALDLAQNPALEYLDCAECSLSSLDLSANPELKELRAGWNKLKSLDLSKNEKLQVLWCTGNSISSLLISNCTALQSLECNDNKIKSLDLSAMNDLTSLQADDNPLASLIIPTGGKLNDLSATGCDLDSSSFSMIVSWASQPGHYASIDGFDDEYDDEDDS